MSQTSSKVLVIMAHPDDPEFFSGGTLARWASEGKEICYLLATSGDKGSNNSLLRFEQMAAQREAEQHAAAKVIGVQEVIFLRHRDGELVSDMALRRELTRAIRLCRPDIVVTTDPNKFTVGDRRINHPDHRIMGEAVLGAVFPAAGNPRFFPELEQVEGLEPHTPGEVYIASPLQPNYQIDITDFIDQKIEAIRQHRSQLTDPDGQLGRVRQRALKDDGRFVEYFIRIAYR